MLPFISKFFNTLTQQILGHTLYEMMCSSPDFEDVKVALNDRTDWSIELFRSCFPLRLTNGNDFFMPCALSFLVVAETVQVQYGRLSPAELKERAEGMGYTTFAILIAALDVGFVVVRIAGLVALSLTPGLAVGLVLVSMSPSVIFPLLAYAGKLAERRRGAPDGGELGTEV